MTGRDRQKSFAMQEGVRYVILAFVLEILRNYLMRLAQICSISEIELLDNRFSKNHRKMSVKVEGEDEARTDTIEDEESSGKNWTLLSYEVGYTRSGKVSH